MKPCDNTPELEFFVSVDGSDETGDGSLLRPFLSIQKARQTLRQIISGGLTADACIRIMGGAYFLTEPIVIGPGDFDPNHRVIYTNYNGEAVYLTGGVPVTGWTGPDEHGIFQADVPGRNGFYALYENGQRLTPARAEHWDGIHICDPSHLQAVYGNATSWFGEVLKVKEISGDTVITNFPKGAFSGELQYLQGAREFITAPGQWAIEGNRVCCKPLDPANFETAQIIAGITPQIFRVEGSADAPVKNIVIRDLRLQMGGFGEDLQAHAKGDERTVEFPENLQGLVTLKYAESINVEYCHLSNAGYVGVVLQRHCQNCRVYGNHISHTGYAGIFLIGDDPGSLNYYNKNNTVSNNLIRDVGEFVGHGAGIYLINSGENRITHNRISNAPRYGISMKGIRYGVFDRNNLSHVPFEDHWKYNQTTGNYIGCNKVFNTGIRSGDGGGIEGWGIGRDNHIDRNIIYNAYRGPATTGWRGHSIFLDDAAHHTTVTNNIIYDENAVAVNAGIFIKSINNRVINNVFDVGYAMSGAADIMPYICPAGGSVFERNIVYSAVAGTVHPDGSWTEEGNGDRVMFFISDRSNHTTPSAFDSLDIMNRNLYFNAAGNALFRVNDQLLGFEQWQTCPENRNQYDASSLVADPLFLDAQNHDYRLAADSPARSLGIESIETEGVGLLADFPFPIK